MAVHLKSPNYKKEEDRDCMQCMFKKQGRRRCKNRTCYLFPYCYVHLRQVYGLVLAPSTIDGGGRGLFFVGYRKPDGQWKKILYPPDTRGRGGDIVTYYSSPTAESKKAFDDRYDRSGRLEPVYAYETRDHMVLDSRNTLNFPGRFLNDVVHTTKSVNTEFGNRYEWNSEFKRYMLPLLPKTRIDARNGPVELLLSYGSTYW